MQAVNAIEGFKLSPQQRHAWSHPERLEVARCQVAVEGCLDLERLRAALRQVVARHEILRTRFFTQPGYPWPVQRIESEAEPDLRLLDLPSMMPDRQKASLEELFQEASRKPFKPESGPLLRAVLVTLAAEEQALLLEAPILCVDSWTMRNLVCELAALLSGDGTGLEAEPMQYADFSEWQNELVAESAGEGADYWRSVEVPLTLTPALFPAARNGDESGRPESVAWHLSGELRQALESLASAFRVPLAAVLLTSWQILLQRVCGEQNLLVGEVNPGRKFPPLHTAFGPFSKVLPVRCRFEEGFRFDEALRQTAAALNENNASQEYFSWDLLGAALPDGERFFPFVFELDDHPSAYAAGGVRLSIQRLRCWTEPFALRLRFSRQDPGFLAELSLDPSRVQRETVRHLAGQVDRLLARVAGEPRALLRDLWSPGPGELHLTLVEHNDHRARHTEVAALHRLFEAQAKRTPEHIAVLFDGEEITYGQLNERADRLARLLRRHGIGPGNVVAVLLERSPELIASLLAVLKTGGAFLVVAPDQAPARLAYLLADASARLVLTVKPLRSVLPEGTPEAICLDECDLPGEDEDGPEVVVPPESLAYVVYTSGSTGRPKGVLATHRGAVNYLRYLESTYALGRGDVVLQVASPDFDASVRDLLGPLTCGARLVLARDTEARDPAALLAKIERHGATAILSIVPTMLRALLAEAADDSSCSSLRLVLVSGEMLHTVDCDRLRQRIQSDAAIVNQYGPTECTMTSTYHRFVPGGAGPEVPIGRPIPNVRLYLLDDGLAPVPTGIAGEVYIGGPGLAWGYSNRPDLTARAFVPDPFGDEPGSRLYRTGDRARCLPDGCLQFLGRLDSQVKVRGVRIELEEIEALLRQHPQLREVAVDVRTAASGDPRLVAYAVSRRGAEPKITEIRRFLQPHLPDSMLPSELVLLAALPLTRTGKVDRRALPAPEQRKAAQGFVEPRTATEELLAEIWCNLLGLDRVGAQSDFFESGGHSLLATQLVGRVRKVFEVELPLQSLFERPTLESFAEAIDAALQAGERHRVPPIRPAPREGTLPLSFAQQRHWFLHQLEPANPLLNNAAAVLLQGPLHLPGLERAFVRILERHEVLRTGFSAVGGEPSALIASRVEFQMPMVDLSALPAALQDVEKLALARAESRRPFDLARPPLLRATLLRSSAEEHLFVLVLHHIASDLWSIGVLVRELTALYEESLSDVPARLPALPIQYGDFAVWQRQWLAGEVLSTQLEYWKQQLAELPPPLDLASDPVAGTPGGHRSQQHAIAFAAELTTGLKELSRAEGATIFMTLLAGFQALLHAYSGRQDIVVGAPFANRARPEIEPLIGCFINAVSLRVGLGGNPTFRELLGRVRRVVLQANAHQDVPFERIVEELNPGRSADRLPIFQVVFNFQNAPLPEAGLRDLRVSLLGLDIGAEAKYDLTLYLRETEGRLAGNIRYNATRLGAGRIEEMAEDLERLLESAVTDPEARLADLRGLLAAAAEGRAAERHRHLRESRLLKLQRVAQRSQRRILEAEAAPEGGG